MPDKKKKPPGCRRLAPLLLLLCLMAATVARGATDFRIYAAIQITNNPLTFSNLTVNTDVRQWHTNVTTPASQILVTNTIANARTNLFTHLANYPIAGSTVLWGTNTADVRLMGQVNSNLTVTIVGTWATVTYQTNVIERSYAVTVPYSYVTNLPIRTNIASGLVEWISLTTTSAVPTTATALSAFVNTNGAQTVWGAKTFASFAGTAGNVTNAVLTNATLHGTVTQLTNGYWTNGVLDKPRMTNAVVVGGFVSYGAGTFSTLIGYGAAAAGAFSTAIGWSASASIDNALAIGLLAGASGTNSIAIGNAAGAKTNNAIAVGQGSYATGSNSVAFGSFAIASNQNSVAFGHYVTVTNDNQFIVGNAAHTVTVPGALTAAYQTNSTFAGTNQVTGDWKWTMTTYGSAANGPNTITNPATVLVKITGPTAVWSVNGISGGYAGKHYVLWNASTYSMSLAHESGLAAAADRINTLAGTTVTIGTNGMALLYYDGGSSRWLLGPNTRQNVLFTSSSASGVGTDYSLTATPALVDFGTTDPTLSIPEAGVYQIYYHASYLTGATAGDVFGFKVRNSTDSTDLAGSYVRQANLVANQTQDASALCFYTATNACTLQLWGVNASGARGVVMSTNTYINFLRVN